MEFRGKSCLDFILLVRVCMHIYVFVYMNGVCCYIVEMMSTTKLELFWKTILVPSIYCHTMSVWYTNLFNFSFLFCFILYFSVATS